MLLVSITILLVSMTTVARGWRQQPVHRPAVVVHFEINIRIKMIICFEIDMLIM